MKLLLVELFGEYKGLKDQRFDFSEARGDVAVLIGANGSGKSQVMELVAEVFAYLERTQRKDFRVRGQLGYNFRLSYRLASSRFQGDRLYVIDSRDGVRADTYDYRGATPAAGDTLDPAAWHLISSCVGLEEVLLPRVVGYASGLSENLQRPFLRNSLQFFDVIRVRSRLKKELAQPKVDEAKTIEINTRYLKRHSGIFAPEGDEAEPSLFRLRETVTAAPRSLFLDYDCAALLIAVVGMLEPEARSSIWRDIPFRHPARAVFRFDLRGQATATDNARDIQRLIELAGPDKLTPLSPRTNTEQYDVFQLDYLAGDVELNLLDDGVIARCQESGRDPSQWFFALYKLQLLGVEEWAGDMKLALRRDSFQGHVKKPLKGKLPLSVRELWMSDGHSSVGFDDLSDGEVQLLLTLGAVRLFGDDETLFLYDEPETHLNPNWRTHFHLDFEAANEANGSAQAFVTSHSPFLVSSLPKETVFHFEKVDGKTVMTRPASETFGASFDVLIKKHFNLKASISETAVQEIRAKLANHALTTPQKLEWLEESVGESMERSYLLNKLRSE